MKYSQVSKKSELGLERERKGGKGREVELARKEGRKGA